MKNKYALLSVFDKEGIVSLAETLTKLNYQIISTGGTEKILKKNGIEVIPAEKITGNPELFDGRIKTLSFQIESGILFNRSSPLHQKQAKTHGVLPIDIVVCNLYPFEKTVKNPRVKEEEVIDAIDVGGPTMVRAAAKNYKDVLVVVDPNDYSEISKAIKTKEINIRLRKRLATKAFYHLSFYDSQIAAYLSSEDFPQELTLPLRKVLDLRYGENPHQSAAAYLDAQNNSPFSNLNKHWGRDLSLTNITDINAGIESVRIFSVPCAVVIKHNNPCGIALGETISEALLRAIDSDPESAFGGTIVVNRALDQSVVKIIKQFVKEGRGNFDILAGDAVSKKTLTELSEIRKSMGIYTFGNLPKKRMDHTNIKWIDGGLVLQTLDSVDERDFKAWKVVTKKSPSKKQLEQMKIAWKFITRIKSNSVIVVDPDLPQTRGIGSGQTSRIRSVKISLSQAGDHAKDGIMASDSFFPFGDSVKLANKYKIGAIIQQGGSVNDKESIKEADNAGIPMVFTGRRAFWH